MLNCDVFRATCWWYDLNLVKVLYFQSYTSYVKLKLFTEYVFDVPFVTGPLIQGCPILVLENQRPAVSSSNLSPSKILVIPKTFFSLVALVQVCLIWTLKTVGSPGTGLDTPDFMAAAALSPHVCVTSDDLRRIQRAL